MQRIIQKLSPLLVATLLMAGAVAPLVITTPVWAEDPPCVTNKDDPAYSANPCPEGDSDANGNCSDANNLQDCDIVRRYINPFVNFLAALFGIIATISMVIGAVQYGSAAGEPQKAAAARARIRNTVIAIAAFSLLYAGISFLIPGGVI